MKDDKYDPTGGIPRQGKEADGELCTYRKGSTMPANKYLSRLHVFDDEECHSFQYSGLDPHSHYEPGLFILTFRGLGGGHRVTVKGRNLWKIYDYITLHRWGAIVAVPESRDMGKETDPVIEKIKIDLVEDEGKPFKGNQDEGESSGQGTLWKP